jgi:hypothetical protein
MREMNLRLLEGKNINMYIIEEMLWINFNFFKNSTKLKF